MLLTTTLVISSLVLLNLLLLKFSCNKTVKSAKVDRKPVVLRTRITVEPTEHQLGATGS